MDENLGIGHCSHGRASSNSQPIISARAAPGSAVKQERASERERLVLRKVVRPGAGWSSGLKTGRESVGEGESYNSRDIVNMGEGPAGKYDTASLSISRGNGAGCRAARRGARLGSASKLPRCQGPEQGLFNLEQRRWLGGVSVVVCIAGLKFIGRLVWPEISPRTLITHRPVLAVAAGSRGRVPADVSCLRDSRADPLTLPFDTRPHAPRLRTPIYGTRPRGY